MPARYAVHGSMPARKKDPATTSEAHSGADRGSMAPTISRIVIPTTTMPSTENDISIARKFAHVRK